MRKWKIWYADESTFSSDDGNPEDAPGLGVVVIGQEWDESGKRCFQAGTEIARNINGYDWYIVRDGYWFATNLVGLTQYFAEPGFKVVKVGQWVAPERYDRLMQAAIQWRIGNDD